MSAPTWVPPSLKSTPLVRVRDYGNFTTGLITGAANSVAILIQPCLSSTNLLVLGQVGKFGAGVTVGTSGTLLQTFQGITGSFPTGRARCHRIGVTLACLGPTAAGALLPTSFVRIGCARAVVNPSDFATYNDIVNWAGGKSEFHTRTAYELMMKPAHCCTYPVDMVEWESLKSATNISSTGYSGDDSLGTIVVTLSPSTTLDQYNLTVHVDYDLLPSDDQPTLVHSCAVVHPSLPMAIIDGAVSAASSVAGVFEKGMQIAGSVGRITSAIHQFTSPLPRAYPPIAMRGVPALTM